MAFNENTRVKLPAILHLCRLGYTYLPLGKAKWDPNTNIFTGIFLESVGKLNPERTPDEIKRALDEVTLALDNEDLGQAFYKLLTYGTGVKLFDFNDPGNNSYHVVTELTCKNGEDEFRPDITLLFNGMPLAFIEVKKPNNREGILAERDRINTRFKNTKFRRFINLSQLLVFSNNMEYDTESIEPVQGAFYSTTSYSEASFNCFREEQTFDLQALLAPEDDSLETAVLKDNNLVAIKHSPEFLTNKDPRNPTNRVLTSLCSKERFATLLKYAIAYVRTTKGLEKHIMRYPQFFATKAIERKLDAGVRKGIIWHTQGSGKTALAYYNVHALTDYYQGKGIVPKFFFIVDRLDLLDQAKREFTCRGLKVHVVDSRDDMVKDFSRPGAIHNDRGEREITVVNIQKFKEETDVVKGGDYNLGTQRVFFLDEVHRSYDPEGSFLANLVNADRNAITIGLTGTPLISTDRRSKDLFGDYIHKYYYNASIADGYTLKLIREGIETNYKARLREALKEIEVLKGMGDKRQVFAHARFVEPMLDYIVEDFVKSRIRLDDHSIGGLVVCDSNEQARKVLEVFKSKYNPQLPTLAEVQPYAMAAEPAAVYGDYTSRHKQALTAALILHDFGNTEERKEQIEQFKEGKIDLLFVNNMLLTGFDAPRLKKLYLGRKVKSHNLLQTLTRVNRTYRAHRYGYVVDFADITKEFDATNKAYFDELQQELGDEMGSYSSLFKTKEEIEAEIADIQEHLFRFDLLNAEAFSQQISQIQDRAEMLAIKKALENVKSLYNLIRLLGHFDLLGKFDFKKLGQLYNVAADHLHLLNLKESLKNDPDSINLLNVALEDVLFQFRKVSEDELVIADELKNTLRQTREALAGNFDKKDPVFISLYDELKRLFDKKNLDEVTQEDMKRNIGELRKIHDKVAELNRRNELLRGKYRGDAKYARVHKRVLERGGISQRESQINEMLLEVKREADDTVGANEKLLSNEAYFAQLLMGYVTTALDKEKLQWDAPGAQFINACVVREYMNEFNGRVAW
ncbi:MAG: type I restriction endonuclease [Flavobacteriales bacterium]|nr:type I restriction endonuclease [Flavobacteriales bacterium]